MEFQPEPYSRIVILGRTRCGKTHLSRKIQSVYPRVVILDIVQDYTPDGNTHFFSDFKAFGEFMLKAQHHSKFRVVFQFSIHNQMMQETANEVFALLFDVGNLLVVVDECQYYNACHYLRQLILVGARKNISTLTITQRPANLSKDIISQASDIFIGKLFETNDVKYLKDFIPSTELDSIVKLQPRQFLFFKAGEASKIVSND